jgi:hypothetical protein
MNSLARNLRAAQLELAAREQQVLRAIDDNAWIDGDDDDMSDAEYWCSKLGTPAAYAN